jgi:hypothetical protein
MPKVNKTADIITLPSLPEDRIVGANYASRTLPWTFNRMSKNTSAKGQIERGLNIAKGIVAQEVLRRSFNDRGIDVELHRKSHRDEDLFDFRIVSDGQKKLFDVKSVSYFNNYADVGRPPFSKKWIIDNSDYPGPDWRRFFPMLVPHTQIDQKKDAYVFLISESVDFRRTVLEGRSDHFIAAFPYGEGMPFYTYKKLCRAREELNKGFYLRFEYQPTGLFSREKLELDVLYEWAAKNRQESVTLKLGEQSTPIGPMSVLNCLSLKPAEFKKFSGALIMWAAKNDFKGTVFNSKKENINQVPSSALTYSAEDFCNLILPDEYKLHCVGWIRKPDFLEACKQYPAWVWPIDSTNRFHNTEWSQVSPRDLKFLEHMGVADRISRKPTRIQFGLLKTSGHGQGACCYVFPNVFGTGLKETNLYVLPQDLQTMESLKP